jgi:hypothetical protein
MLFLPRSLGFFSIVFENLEFTISSLATAID